MLNNTIRRLLRVTVTVTAPAFKRHIFRSTATTFAKDPSLISCRGGLITRPLRTSPRSADKDELNSFNSNKLAKASQKNEGDLEEENTALTEILTIYERMTKGRDPDNSIFRATHQGLSSYSKIDDMIPMVPLFIQEITDSKKEPIKSLSAADKKKDTCNELDFNKYRDLSPAKYVFFSAKTGLIQSETLEGLCLDYYGELLVSKFYWLNITDPSEADLDMLSSSYNVHDLTISDINERNTEEKIEIFKHYTYISLKLITEDREAATVGDNDFNVLLFKDFVITMHDREWSGINDILGFLNLLCCNASGGQGQGQGQAQVFTSLTPSWVLFSAFIELKQDAMYLISQMEPEINRIRIVSKSMLEMSDVMKRIFDMEFQIYTVSRFVKPKMNILRILETKCDKRLNKVAVQLIYDVHDDFKEMSHEMETFSHILERSQDTVLGLVNVEKTKEATEASKVMNRISQIALVFLPIQAATGFFGMNVHVPFQNEVGTLYFWVIVVGSTSLAFTAYLLRRTLLVKSFTNSFKK